MGGGTNPRHHLAEGGRLAGGRRSTFKLVTLRAQVSRAETKVFPGQRRGVCGGTCTVDRAGQWSVLHGLAPVCLLELTVSLVKRSPGGQAEGAPRPAEVG